MAKRKYSEVEMIGALKQMEAGRSAAEVGRELGVSKHTIYAWIRTGATSTPDQSQHPHPSRAEREECGTRKFKS
jgi:transposase